MKVTESALRKYIRERVRLLDEAVKNPKNIPAKNISGYLTGVGGMAGAAAVVMAIEAKQPGKYSYASAGVGSSTDDLLVTGSGTSISIEVKYGATMNSAARFDVTKGTSVASKLADLLVFVVGTGGNVDFVVAHTSAKGAAFANPIFGTTKPFNTSAGKASSSGGRQYVTLNANQMKKSGGGKVVNSTISEGEAHMIAFSEYCKTSVYNKKMAAEVAKHISLTAARVIEIQCKFDSNFSSCLTSILRKRDNRWLPVIPDFNKSGGKYKAFKKYFKDNESNFTDNETNAAVHDYSTGGGGKGKGKGKGKNVNKPTGNLSQDIANAFGLTITTVDAIINGAPSAKAFDELFGNLTSTGKIGVGAAKAFVAAGDPAFLIELIQAGIDQTLITKAAAKLILEEYNNAKSTSLSTAGTLKTLYNRINGIKITPSKPIKVTKPTTKHLKSLTPAKALAAINKYRVASGWQAIKDVAALKKVVSPAGKLDGRDFSNAVRYDLSSRAAQLFENLDSVYDEQQMSSIAINNFLGASQVTQAALSPMLSDLLREDEFELPDDFTAKTDIEFWVDYDAYALSQVEEALNFAAIDLFDFVNELEESINALGEAADSKNIRAVNVPDEVELGLEKPNMEPEPEKLDSEKIDTDDMDFSALDQIVTKSPLKLKQQKIDADDVLPPYQINDLPTSVIPYSYQDDDPQEVEQVMQEIRQKMVRRLIREVLRKKLK